ncbi:winged helix-turn-helix domain-containing protein [Pseudomonas sp. NPDC089407]|uniref:winged helix-turn-helix domain-containing protein n=1 Tax=Pseudomonas sp. NPDC089407 TaxID=3364464 RepID=UPI00384C844C
MIAAVSNSDELCVADLRLILRKRQVICGSKALTVKAMAFRLLHYLANNSGELVTKDAVLAAVWGYDFHPGTKIVEVQLHEVRRVLQELSSAVEITTYRGRGMRLSPRPKPAPLAIPRYCNAVPV